jgi:hypothetical protein
VLERLLLELQENWGAEEGDDPEALELMASLEDAMLDTNGVYQTIRHREYGSSDRARSIEDVLNQLDQSGHEVRVVSLNLVERKFFDYSSCESLEWHIVIYSKHVFTSRELQDILIDSSTPYSDY